MRKSSKDLPLKIPKSNSPSRWSSSIERPSALLTICAVSLVRLKGEAIMRVILYFFSSEIRDSTCTRPRLVSPYSACISELTIFFTLFSASPWRITKYVLPDFFVYFFNSSREPMAVTFPLASFQIGKGLAQKRWREIDQSRAPRSHLPKRPSFICAGNHVIPFAFLNKFSLIFVTETNH